MLRGGLFAGEYALPVEIQDRHLEANQKIYVMAHRCNTKGWFDHALKWEANAFEIDDKTVYAWHGDVGGWEKLSRRPS